MKKLIIPLLLLLVLPLSAQTEKQHNFKIAKNIGLFNEVYRYLDAMYVDTLDADTIIPMGINAMLSTLDPYTEFYPEQDKKDFQQMFAGKYAGIGAIIHHNYKLDRTVIWEPYEGMPAAEVGLKRGDIILAIDDESMIGKTDDYVSSHLRGEAGTSFILKIKRPTTGKTMKFKITRRAIQMPAIDYAGVKDSIGYISLNQFTENCARDIRNHVIDMRKQGIKGIVLDLRDNGGGLEEEAVKLVNIFIPRGKVVVTNRGQLKRMTEEFKTTTEPVDTVIPLVVLVNGNTASSSEITSGALQDYDRAVIMGQRTYGKGIVQSTVPLQYNAMLKLTTGKYYIPSGRCIQAIRYTHGRGGKWQEEVPDSLAKVFHTANGREVLDSKGIKPDVEVTPDSMSNIAAALFSLIDSTNTVADYEMQYVAKHPTIAPAGEFEISDADYEEFKKLVLSNGFKYDMYTERYLKELKKLAQFEGYYEEAKEDFAALEKKLAHNVAHDLDYHKDEIKNLLAAEIVSCYYYQKGVEENGLLHDKFFKEAVRLINNPAKYHELLQPKKK
ncbi:MAG: S41 family peptidase [Prevotella sp.]|jgi:carboxyl-terminal processing protease